MSRKYNRKWTVDQFEEGDLVAVEIPRALRTSTDNLRLYATVLDRPHRDRYTLRSRHGIIDRNMRIKDLERVPAEVASTIEIPLSLKKISLKKAAELESTSTRVLVSCQCKGNCASRRCRCVKEELRCTKHYHREDVDCGNLTGARTKRLQANTAAESVATGDEEVIIVGQRKGQPTQ